MKIRYLEFFNPFEGFTDNIILKNLDDINVIIGKNNSGKTTILYKIFQILNTPLIENHQIRKLFFELKIAELNFILFVLWLNLLEPLSYEELQKRKKEKEEEAQNDFISHRFLGLPIKIRNYELNEFTNRK